MYSAYFIGIPLPSMVSTPGTAGLLSASPVEAPRDAFHESSLWWRMHRIVKSITESPVERKLELRSLFDPIEKSNRLKVEALLEERFDDNRNLQQSFIDQQHEQLMDAILHIEKAWKLS
jgi:hypothetical protein